LGVGGGKMPHTKGGKMNVTLEKKKGGPAWKRKGRSRTP